MSLLTRSLAVEVLRPADAGYGAATRGFYRTGHPALVVRPGHPDEVAAALDYAARHGMPVAVRSGGHSPLDRSAHTGAMVIDLVRLGGVEVLDTERRRVRVGGGATWGRVAAALDPHGWALTAGDTAGVGVGGLTLGGGIGWMVRRYGLAIDNLVGARTMTADGRMLRTSPDDHPDLFWGLRGGGGGFGVVVDFDFVAQPVATVHFGSVTYQVDDLADLLGRWRDAMRAAPDELSSTLGLPPRRAGVPPSATLLLCHTGGPGLTASEVRAAIVPLRELGTVTAVKIAERRYVDVLEDAAPPRGLRLTVRSTLAPALDDAMVAAIVGLHAGPVPMAIEVRSLGGAFSRVPTDATAFAHRDAEAMVVGLLMLPDTSTPADVERALVPWRAVADHGAGPYVNFQGSATAEDLAAAYPPTTSARLRAIKRRYDPGNRFALTPNVDDERT
jgi:FAD/FMN-containing dehydrogenase